jgi:hypothetical protein
MSASVASEQPAEEKKRRRKKKEEKSMCPRSKQFKIRNHDISKKKTT